MPKLLQSYDIITGKWHTWIVVLLIIVETNSPHLYVAVQVVIFFFFLEQFYSCFERYLLWLFFAKNVNLTQKKRKFHTKEQFYGLCSDFTGFDFLIIFLLRELFLPKGAFACWIFLFSKSTKDSSFQCTTTYSVLYNFILCSSHSLSYGETTTNANALY